MKALATLVAVGVLCVGFAGCDERRGGRYGYEPTRYQKVSRHDRDAGWVGPGRTDTRRLFDKFDAADKLGGPVPE